MFDWTSPPCETEIPGVVFMNSAIDVAGLPESRSVLTTEIDAGASSTFSCVAPREAVVTTSFRREATSSSAKFAVTVPPDATRTPSARLAA